MTKAISVCRWIADAVDPDPKTLSIVDRDWFTRRTQIFGMLSIWVKILDSKNVTKTILDKVEELIEIDDEEEFRKWGEPFIKIRNYDTYSNLKFHERFEALVEDPDWLNKIDTLKEKE